MPAKVTVDIPGVVPMWSGNKPGADGVLRVDVPRSFEEVVLPHLDAAFNYARWLTKNDADAEDVVQDAYLRALRFFSSLRGEDARAWLLTIVRNTWYGRFPRRAGSTVMTVAGEEEDHRADASLDPEAQMIQQQTVGQVRRALETLPTDFREVLVLRELEGLSYKEIAAIVGIPLGTVMSRLARARERLAGVLATSELSGGLRGLP
jgi:RNA polymerase sigma factor (sigma-70 family)